MKWNVTAAWTCGSKEKEKCMRISLAKEQILEDVAESRSFKKRMESMGETQEPGTLHHRLNED